MVTYFAVENNLKEGKCVTTEPEIFQSPVWKQFSEIVDAASKKYEGFIICSTCKLIFAHDKCKSGTTRLKNHWSNCTKKSDKSSLQEKQPKNLLYLLVFDKGLIKFVLTL